MTIDNFMLAELRAMSKNICDNYEKNMENREKNPFLPLDDREMKKYMALGRSVDSQLGNRIQRIIFFLCRQKFGTLGVPNIIELNYDENSEKITITLFSIPVDLDIEWQNKDFNPFAQYVYIASNLSEKEVKRKLKVKSRCDKLETAKISMNLNSPDTGSELLRWNGKNFPVDLLTLRLEENNDSGELIIEDLFVYEIKMGGNLDTKNASSNADEVLKNAKLFSFVNSSHSYFSTCYGECSHAVKSDLIEKNCELLTPDDFWEKVLPVGLTYNDFIGKFKDAFRASRIEEDIKRL